MAGGRFNRISVGWRLGPYSYRAPSAPRILQLVTLALPSSLWLLSCPSPPPPQPSGKACARRTPEPPAFVPDASRAAFRRGAAHARTLVDISRWHLRADSAAAMPRHLSSMPPPCPFRAL
eukprot:363211-Chlamydomonas_euryale.AAC.14